jgi:multidrug efflux system membrane fusion protein
MGAALLVVLGAFWHFTSTPSAPKGPRGGGAAPVRVGQVVNRDMAVVDHTLGKVVAITTVQVTARVQGILDTANFTEGQFVKRGDLLFQIDPRGFQAALAQARAILARDEASLVNATRDRERYANLKESGNVSVQQFDTITTNAAMLAATVAADKAAVETAELNLGYTQIRSPVDGKTGPLLIQPGNMILAGGTTPLVTIAQLKPIKVSFTLPQSELPRIQARQRGKGLSAALDIPAANGSTLAAPVDFTDNAVSATSGTIELRSTFDNADLSLVPGQLVNVTVEMDNIPNALVVPRDAVNDGPDGSFVYVVEGGKAVQHKVTVLFDDGKAVAVNGEIKAGDQVITEGQLRVLPGAGVNVLQAKAAIPQ